MVGGVEYVHPAGARDDFRGNWGGDDLDALSRYDGLQAIRLTALGSYALGLTGTYQPPGANGTARLTVLPNLDIVATGTVASGDELATPYRRSGKSGGWGLRVTARFAYRPG